MRELKKSELLVEVENIITSQLSLTAILQNVMKTIALGLKSEIASLLLLDEELQELRMEVSYGLPEEIVKNVRLKLDGDSISSWVARNGKPLILNGEIKDPRFKGNKPSVKSAMSVPLKIADEVIGVINVSNVEKEVFFTNEDMDLLVSIANQTAALVKSLKLQRLLYTRTQKLEVLAQISNLINSLFNSQELLKRITRIAVDLLKAKGGFSYSRTEEGKFLLSGEYLSEPTMIEGLRDGFLKIVQGVGREREGCITLSRDSDKAFLEGIFAGRGITSILCCPFRTKDKEMGALLVFRESLDPTFTRDEISFFETMCRILSVALYNALLYENLLIEHQKLERAQQRLILHEKIVSLAKFSAGIAHELKNPLTVIMGFGELVEMGVEDPKVAIKRVKDQASRAYQIIEGLKRLSQNRPPVPKQVEINSLLDSSLALLHYRFTRENIELKKNFYEPFLPIMADETQLQQIFLNLIGNALDALDKEKKIIIETRLEDEKAVVKISDTGVGIPPENLNKIFQPFFTTKKEGSGLGLSIVKDLVEANFGEIKLESEVNKGTTFTLFFPFYRGDNQEP